VTAAAQLCRCCRGVGAVVEELRARGWRARRTVACEAPGCVGGVVTPAALGLRLAVSWDGLVGVCRVVEVGLC
jgi:hypothetical protein